MNWVLHSRFAVAVLTAACVVASLSAAQSQQPEPQTAPHQTPLSAEEVRELIATVIAHQHHNDAALDTFERFEHHIEHQGAADGPVVTDKLYRVVPTGSGNLKLLVKENGRAVSTADYQRELHDWENVLQVAIQSDDPRQVAVVAKQQKKLKDRARLIDAVSGAYTASWMGREIRNGHVLEKIQLIPNPTYQPRGDTADWLTHARATIWIDAQDGQLVRADAAIIRDISIGGGILGKVYRGGRFIMEQAPAAPGIWEPTLYQYSLSGRKFIFTFTLYETISSSRYRWIGAPDQALAVVREDLAHCCSAIASDP